MNLASFCNCMFAPKRGGVPAIFMYYWMNSENIHVHDCSYGLTYISKYSCLTGTLSTEKYVYLHCGRSGRWYRPRSCNWGDILNQPPVLCYILGSNLNTCFRNRHYNYCISLDRSLLWINACFVYIPGVSLAMYMYLNAGSQVSNRRQHIPEGKHMHGHIFGVTNKPERNEGLTNSCVSARSGERRKANYFFFSLF